VLELGSVTGIVGITTRKWSSASSVDMTHSHEEAIVNIQNNANLNDVKGINVIKLTWNSNHKEVPSKYGVILTANPFSKECTPAVIQ
jgi:16S rRNA G1207 methylase RsmC